MAGFSDAPVTLPPEAPLFYGTFEAKYVTRYLEEYIDSHVYDGKSLRSRISFGYHVERVEKTDGIWTIFTRTSNHSKQAFQSTKLIVATGLSSLPKLPSLPHQEDFEGPIRHRKHFGEFSKSCLRDPECWNIAVLGGGKSATDMVYQCVKQGKKVTWIIRRNGVGPALFHSAPAGLDRYENSTERGATRWSQYFSPSSFMPTSWPTKLIHGTTLGQNFLSRKIQAADDSCRNLGGYRDREGALPNFRKLESTAS